MVTVYARRGSTSFQQILSEYSVMQALEMLSIYSTNYSFSVIALICIFFLHQGIFLSTDSALAALPYTYNMTAFVCRLFSAVILLIIVCFRLDITALLHKGIH